MPNEFINLHQHWFKILRKDYPLLRQHWFKILRKDYPLLRQHWFKTLRKDLPISWTSDSIQIRAVGYHPPNPTPQPLTVCVSCCLLDAKYNVHKMNEAMFTNIIGHVGYLWWVGPNVWWEISQIWIEYIQPIEQMSDEPWKFLGYTDEVTASNKASPDG